MEAAPITWRWVGRPGRLLWGLGGFKEEWREAFKNYLNYSHGCCKIQSSDKWINNTVIGQGDVMYVKPDDHTPRAYCNKEAPVYNYPGMSHTASGTGNLKLWWRMSAYPGMYPDRWGRVLLPHATLLSPQEGALHRVLHERQLRLGPLLLASQQP